jgi:glycerol-3-phosphate dehydrogenase (NAD+)
MWVFQEQVDGKNLTEIINSEHENVKYLPGIKFTENVVADPDLASAVTDATLLVFVLPHQFLGRICPQMTTMAKGCRALSLIKGIEFEEGGPILISNMIKDAMGGMDVSVLMGANVANEVARDDFCESTVGFANKNNGLCWQRLLDCPTFRVGSINDVAGVELCGALKNVVALGAGFCDGLGLGGNTKAAIIRIGLKETIKFAKMFFNGVLDDTFLESCGLADLVTTCFGGRNRKCAEAFAKGDGDWDELEKSMLNGQKLQGTITSKDVQVVLKSKNLADEFPLFTRINEIAFEGKAPSSIVEL